ncbi:hypothetical protein [Alkalihalobacillus sp. LMS39]|uniref:hypothetical protein n=1 Tax=Alkalihalobacillus sp. LMS39 TaxID=2924032 RepID=UPI001FB46A4B|nr:hypothetical protein [Alkalihalobacillus sp. LMS39]UOE95422.1 hypothetical protein MM271_07350 [Alkalihalobacillus sp. LMS39]
MNNKMILGLMFVMLGNFMLILTLAISLPTTAWLVLIGLSILFNLTGMVMLLRFIKKGKNSRG